MQSDEVRSPVPTDTHSAGTMQKFSRHHRRLCRTHGWIMSAALTLVMVSPATCASSNLMLKPMASSPVMATNPGSRKFLRPSARKHYKGNRIPVEAQNRGAMTSPLMMATNAVTKPKQAATNVETPVSQEVTMKLESALTATHPQMTKVDPSTIAMMASTEKKVEPESPTVYYYEPQTSTGGTNPGQPVVPDIVYDEQGTPIKLADLAEVAEEIFMEHPDVPSPARKIGEETIEEESSSNTQRDTESKSYAFPGDSGTWDDSVQAQDQLIIVSTVATMALLVGALSARRMRSRQFLSSCIENESLEDEVAYDAAYTTTSESRYRDGGGSVYSHGYDTFGPTAESLRWRGDLEKFDV